MPAALAAARLIHYAAATGLFGLSLFPLYARPLPGLRAWLVGLLAAALASGVAWLLLVTINLAGALDVESLTTVVADMSFGRVWAARLALGVGLLVPLAVVGVKPARTIAALTAAFLCSIALTGHTQIQDGTARLAHVLADALHLAGAGAWLGGLIGLVLMLRPSGAGDVASAVARFSRMAYLAVAALTASGVVNALVLIHDWRGLFASDYGRLLLLKLALVSAMLVLAAVNRFAISPRLAGPDAAAQIRRLRNHVIAEQALAIAVLGCVAWLGLGQPPA